MSFKMHLTLGIGLVVVFSLLGAWALSTLFVIDAGARESDSPEVRVAARNLEDGRAEVAV